jgi:hypothetical protein
MLSIIEQTDNTHADSDAGNQLNDSRRTELHNWLLLFDLQQLKDEVNPDWQHGEYSHDVPFFHNGYILCYLLYYYNRSVVDEELQDIYTSDFNE